MLAVGTLFPQALAQAPITPTIPAVQVVPQQTEPTSTPLFTTPKAEAAEFSVSDLKLIATNIATNHGLNVDHFLTVIGCESQWNPKADGDYPDGHGGWVAKKYAPEGAQPTTFGLVLLHYPTRDWGIATSTAYQPITSMEMMAAAWNRGEQRRWSCWTKYYGP